MSGFDALIRSFLERRIQAIKRDPNYRLDPALSGQALISVASRRMVSVLRCWRWAGCLRQEGGIFFVGRGVQIRHPGYLSLGRSVTLEDGVIIDALSRTGVTVGDNVSIGAYTIIEASGILTRLGEGFAIGRNSNLGDYCYVGAAGGVSIGENVLIGQRVSFHSENHIFLRTDLPIKAQGTTQQGIVVEDDCWLGSGAIILDGVTIHRGSVVAAGSVVNKNVPPYSVVGGVPAVLVHSRVQEEAGQAGGAISRDDE